MVFLLFFFKNQVPEFSFSGLLFLRTRPKCQRFYVFEKNFEKGEKEKIRNFSQRVIPDLSISVILF